MPLDATSLERIVRTKNGLFEAILSRMSEAERLAFSESQINTLKGACTRLQWNSHPVDIRLSIPMLFARYYFVLMAGREHRSAARRKEERQHHPLLRWGNIIFAGSCLLVLLYAVVFAEALLVRTMFAYEAPQ